MKQHSVFGIKIDDISRQELKSLLNLWLEGNSTHKIFTPNPEFVLLARTNTNFVQLLNQSDLSPADGVGLKFAVRLLTKDRLLHRQTGVDTVFLLAELCSFKNRKILLFGGEGDVGKNAATRLKQLNSNLQIDAINPGFINGSASSINIDHKLIEQINQFKPDVICVALNFGKQEKFISEIASSIPTLKIIIGIGGALDIISGKLSRAPKFMRKMGFEWLWRLIIEPKRVARIIKAVIVFPIVVIWAKMKKI